MSFLELDNNDQDELSKGHIVDLSKGGGTALKERNEKDGGYFEAIMEHSAEESDESIDSFVKRTEEEYRNQAKKKDSHVHGSEEDSSCTTDDKDESSCNSEEVESLPKEATNELEATRLALKDLTSESSLNDAQDIGKSATVSSDEDYVMVNVGEGEDSAMPVEEQVEESVIVDDKDDGTLVGESAEESDAVVVRGGVIVSGDEDDQMIGVGGVEEEQSILTKEKEEDSETPKENDDVEEVEKKESDIVEVGEAEEFEMESDSHDPLTFGEEERIGMTPEKEERGEEVITGENVELVSVAMGENESSGSLLNTFPHEEERKQQDEKEKMEEIKTDQDTIEGQIENSFGFEDSEDLTSNIDVQLDTSKYEERAAEQEKPLESLVKVQIKPEEDVDLKNENSNATEAPATTKSTESRTVVLQDSLPSVAPRPVESSSETLDRGKDNTIKVRILKVQNKQGAPSNVLMYPVKETPKVGAQSETVEGSKLSERQNHKGSIMIGSKLGDLRMVKKGESVGTGASVAVGIEKKNDRSSPIKKDVLKQVDRSSPVKKDVLKQVEVMKKKNEEKTENSNKKQREGTVLKIVEGTDGPKLKKVEGSQVIRKRKVATDISSKETSSTDKSDASSRPAKRSAIVQKKVSNIERVKRKLEKVMEISKAEEEEAIAELQQMKKEKKDILDKINSEMKKLKDILAKEKPKQEDCQA